MDQERKPIEDIPVSDGEIASDEKNAGTAPEAPTEILPETESAVPVSPAPPVEPTVVYRWNYEEQTRRDARAAAKTRRGGAWTFALIMSICFGLTLLLLIASLVSGDLVSFLDGNKNETVDPNGSLTRPPVSSSTDEGTTDGELSTQEIVARGNEVVVAITTTYSYGTGGGTGIIMTADGYIATNAHVVDGAETVSVQLYGGATYDATVVGASDIDDLAVLKIEAEGLPVAVFADTADVRVGDRVVVIGHPTSMEFSWTSTFGYISGVDREIILRDDEGVMTKKMKLLQTDANVNHGNSGGPIFNSRGEVIGIVNMKLSNSEGMGFAIPAKTAVPLLEALMRTGTTDGVQSGVSSARPVLGITGVSVEKDKWYVLGEDRIRELTEEEAAQTEGSFKAGTTGVLITDIQAGTGAEGILAAGDILTDIDGHEVIAIVLIREYLYELNAGDTIQVTYFREGETHQAAVTLTAAQD